MATKANNAKNIAKGVSDVHKQYEKYAPKWKRARDVVSGQDAIYAGGIAYLPMLAEQQLAEYVKYQQRTPFYNATWRTIAGFIGMLFRKPATLNVPDKMKELLKDVTMSGVDFNSFAQDCVFEDLVTSRLGVLVDHPALQQDAEGKPIELTVAQSQELGMRPSLSKYNAESIINWKFETRNNVHTLVQVRLRETVEEEVSEFETEAKDRIRVLDLTNEGKYRVRLFDAETEEQIGGDIYPLMNGTNLSYIPFFFIGPDGAQTAIDDPILIDLVDLNIKHFQVSADYENGCHLTGLPTVVVSGYKTDSFTEDGKTKEPDFYIGSSTAWIFPDPNAKAEFLEFKGQGLQALEKNLDRKEGQMAAIGARMLAPEKKAAEAAETLHMRHAGEHSILGAIAVAVSGALLEALKVFAEWAGITGDIEFEINRDFVPLSVDSSTLTSWLALVQAGQMSAESLFDLLQRADLIDPEIDFEEEQERIDNTELPAPIGRNGGPSLDDENDDEEDDEEDEEES